MLQASLAGQRSVKVEAIESSQCLKAETAAAAPPGGEGTDLGHGCGK